MADAGDEPAAWLARDADGAVSLLGGRSPTSGRHHFPPAGLCPYSGADDVEVVPLPRTGSLWAWTAVTSAPPGYEGPVPYGFGIVELDGIGLRVVGRLTEPDPSALRHGQPMVVTTETLPGGRVFWAFAPGDPAEA
ncbi:MAG: Zn-ribbon domain-containing OB-fold protein [Acidimicrobiales bacterium]